MPYVIQWVEPTEEAPDYFAPYKEEDPFYLEGIEKGKSKLKINKRTRRKSAKKCHQHHQSSKCSNAENGVFNR